MTINKNSVEQINVALLDLDKKIKSVNNASDLKNLEASVDSIKRTLNETAAGLESGKTYNINISGNAATATRANNAGTAETATTAETAISANHADTADTATTAAKVANALTVNGKTYDGSSAVNAGVQSKTVEVGDITIPSNNYLEIDVGLSSSDTVISAKLTSWSSNTGSFSIICYAKNKVYIVGNAGTTITNVSVQAIYI
jgi:hypothetical protein